MNGRFADIETPQQEELDATIERIKELKSPNSRVHRDQII
jgi:hypothetical protein